MLNSSREEKIERASIKAGDYEELSVNCAQGTLVALMEEFDLPGGKELIQAASFFPGVMLRRETCGAVLGGLMALGLVYGRDKLFDPAWKTPEAGEQLQQNRMKAWNFCETFKERWGSTMCGAIRPAIMGRDYNTMIPEERAQFIADDGPKKCRIPAEYAARLVAEILLEDGIIDVKEEVASGKDNNS